jgi:regulatory protein
MPGRRDSPGSGSVSADTLMRMATYYLARHSASASRLREVLARKIRRRLTERRDGTADPEQAFEAPDEAALRSMIDPVIERLQRIGLLDDAAFARGRAANLAAKGRPAWRIRTELAQHGIAADEVGLGETLADLDPLAQADVWARRRRLGPYRLRDREGRRDRDVASLVRAGFPVAVAIAVIDRKDEGD